MRINFLFLTTGECCDGWLFHMRNVFSNDSYKTYKTTQIFMSEVRVNFDIFACVGTAPFHAFEKKMRRYGRLLL